MPEINSVAESICDKVSISQVIFVDVNAEDRIRVGKALGYSAKERSPATGWLQDRPWPDAEIAEDLRRRKRKLRRRLEVSKFGSRLAFALLG
jgi:hypothetical protein